MRPLSLALAFAFIIAGPLTNSSSLTTSRDLPGVGTFTYTGTPVVIDAPRVLAAAMQR